MLNLWIIFIVPALAFAADPQSQQRTTVNFPSNNNGVSSPQQPLIPNSVGMQSQANVGVTVGDAPYPINPNTMAYYRNLEMQPGGGQPGAVFPPEHVPNFYFNAGFNKGNSLFKHRHNICKLTDFSMGRSRIPDSGRSDWR